MTLLDAIPARHSVRAYTDRPIPPEAAEQLRAELQAGNQAGGLHMHLVTDDPAAFEGLLAHYGKFRGVRHYIALIGPKTPDLEEKLGYYGERAALLAPTAMNQQKFRLTWSGTQVKAVSTGGFYSNVDLGIVKCHFELGAGTDSFTWA